MNRLSTACLLVMLMYPVSPAHSAPGTSWALDFVRTRGSTGSSLRMQVSSSGHYSVSSPFPSTLPACSRQLSPEQRAGINELVEGLTEKREPLALPDEMQAALRSCADFDSYSFAYWQAPGDLEPTRLSMDTTEFCASPDIPSAWFDLGARLATIADFSMGKCLRETLLEHPEAVFNPEERW